MENTRVYGINLSDLIGGEVIGINDISDNEWIYLSEKQGLIWSVKGFEFCFNNENIDTDNLLIRFIKL